MRLLNNLIISILEKLWRLGYDLAMAEVIINQTRISLLRGDITRRSTDAIVNAANPNLMGGGGVDGAIHRSGGPAITEECQQIVARQGALPTGQAVITGGGNLNARFVIHTVGPIWHGGKNGEAELLASAYRENLKLAADNNLSSLALPSISTGAYGYPVAEAARVAIRTIVTYLRKEVTSIKEVAFVLFDGLTLASYTSALEEILKESKEVTGRG